MKEEVADEAREVGRGQFTEDASVILKNFDFNLGKQRVIKNVKQE